VFQEPIPLVAIQQEQVAMAAMAAVLMVAVVAVQVKPGQTVIQQHHLLVMEEMLLNIRKQQIIIYQ
jgi:acetyl/propionyl-CoA carboxylase alpha subunit